MYTRCLEDVDWFTGLSSQRQTDIRTAMAKNFATQLCVDNNGKPYLSLGNLDEETLMTDAHSVAVKMGFIEKTPKTLTELTKEAFPDADRPRGLRVMVIEDTAGSIGTGQYRDKYKDHPNQTSAIIDLYEEKISRGKMILKYHPEPYGEILSDGKTSGRKQYFTQTKRSK